MIEQSATPPPAVVDAFVTTAHRIVWCSVATVDRRHRPRARVLHPIWEPRPDGLVGWIVTRPTPLKRAHLAHVPYLTCSYWDATHDVAIADCAASWVGDRAVHSYVWDLFREADPPLGFDFEQIFPDGPTVPDAALLRLDPWRLHVADLDVLYGRKQAFKWRRESGGLAAGENGGGTARFLLRHSHQPHECAATFAAWRGHPGPLRECAPLSTCRFGGHELIWELNAADEQEALAQLPRYVAERSRAERIDRVTLP